MTRSRRRWRQPASRDVSRASSATLTRRSSRRTSSLRHTAARLTLKLASRSTRTSSSSLPGVVPLPLYILRFLSEQVGEKVGLHLAGITTVYAYWKGTFWSTNPGCRSWGWRCLDRLKICRRGHSMFWPPKMPHSFIQNCCWLDNCASFTASRIKDLRYQRKVKLYFEAPTGCLELGLLNVWKSLT